MSNGFIWLASYPKSGNTYLRLLLEAYYCNTSSVDINSVAVTTADVSSTIIQAVSPMPLDMLGFRGEALVRPAGLLNFYTQNTEPVICKTHWANLQSEGLPPFIPKEFTYKAIYVVRDPRSVFPSFSSYFGFPPEQAVEKMASQNFVIGGNKEMAKCLVSSWSVNVGSWVGEKNFPVHVVRYEDMVDNPEKELREVLEFLDKEIDDDRVLRAVDATRIEKLQKDEAENGFSEHRGKSDSFFGNGGGSRWKDEVGPKWIRQIEEDHGEIMRHLQYLPGADNVEELKTHSG
jgi:hypothetical protein